MSAAVRVERDGRVARVVVDHPPVNALNVDVVAGLADAFAELEAARDVAVVVVSGAGDRAFVAGADITEFPSLRTEDDAREAMRLPRVLDEIARARPVVIAQIHGYCLGGGLELAMACDLRVAADDARLGQPEVKLGLIPGAGGTQRLPRLVGRSRALLLNVTGEPISGRDAYEWGLVDRVVPAEQLTDEATALARTIARQSPQALETLKRLQVETAELPLAVGLEAEAGGFVRCLLSDDGREGVAAFVEKRPPTWAGAPAG